MYNDYMYGVERNEEFLAHYGIRGMKWGVRKAIKSGNSAKLSRQYAKASKKLAKLEKRAANSSKYAKRAALMGAGAAAAGGLAALGTSGVGRAMNLTGAGLNRGGKAVGSALIRGGYAVGKLGNKLGPKNKITASINKGMNAAGNAIIKGGQAANTGLYKGGYAVSKWGNSNSVAKSAASKYGELAGKYAAPKAGGAYAQKMVSDNARRKANAAIGGVSNNTIARIGAGVVGAGLAAGAAKNAYRAATAKKKAAKFKSEMNKAFAGTKYANGGQPRQGKKRRR